ncbi:HDOD domain-containing protein [Marinobacter oulmenensis]|uniref:HD-like signal output (HDOD) protein n=1 Tax=Marinobacter oulmenensis TaxID=643747 RepID=A0A840U5B0_9GAMM|nr:HDOD domain-containing protein [Marinobacter oulmenensis]MBB5320112.1 HD-like signal output (HDOD) protein [Marinobacter oulmenensis]
MPGFLSWITDALAKRHPPAADWQPRLFNPDSPPTPVGDSARRKAIVEHLESNLFCWLLDAEPHQLRAADPIQESLLAELEQRLDNRQLEELPRKPWSLPGVMRALASDHADRRAVTRTIQSDPSLTEQLLLMANSPYFRPGDQPIESVDHAVFVLGVDGIRNVITAAVMRPMMAARNSREALFAQRTWRWGLACGCACEMIAGYRREDSSAHFMVALLPALAYLTIRRELCRISRGQRRGSEPSPAALQTALSRYQWRVCQLLANAWALPPKYHAWLMAAERPAPRQPHSMLTQALLLGSREVLRHARQRNLPEEELRSSIRLPEQQVVSIQAAVQTMLEESKSPPSRG